MSSSKPRAEAGPAALLRYLRSGVRSASEARAYLRRRGAPPGEAARALKDAETRGLVDDRACARLWADQWARRGDAGVAIRLKLAAKGLSDRVIDEAVTTSCPPSEEEARARLLVTTFLSRRAGNAARLARRLSVRGFDADLIERVLSERFPHAEP